MGKLNAVNLSVTCSRRAHENELSTLPRLTRETTAIVFSPLFSFNSLSTVGHVIECDLLVVHLVRHTNIKRRHLSFGYSLFSNGARSWILTRAAGSPRQVGRI